jgi:hypothetical protein
LAAGILSSLDAEYLRDSHGGEAAGTTLLLRQALVRPALS